MDNRCVRGHLIFADSFFGHELSNYVLYVYCKNISYGDLASNEELQGHKRSV